MCVLTPNLIELTVVPKYKINICRLFFLNENHSFLPSNFSDSLYHLSALMMRLKVIFQKID